MADMKQIFTYPSNSGTDWIDPNYIGNATSGLTMRVDDLLDGTYRDWSNLDPVSDLSTTTSETMKNLSKFINYYTSDQLIENLTFYDFWYNPMVVATKKLIDSENVTATAADPMVVTTSDAHEFEDGMKIDTSGINGSWGDAIDDGIITDMYTKVINTTTLQIATDSALTDIIGFTTDSPFAVGEGAFKMTAESGHNEATIDLTGTGTSGITDGTEMDINSLEDNRYGSAFTPTYAANPFATALVGTTKYLKTTATTDLFEVYNDVGLTDRLNLNDVSPSYSTVGPIIMGIVEGSNPAQVTHSNYILFTEQHEVLVPAGQTVKFTNGEYWGPSRNTDPATYLDPPWEPYWLEYSHHVASEGNYYYNVYSEPTLTTAVDWSTPAENGVGTPGAINENITIIQTDLSESASYQTHSTDANASIQSFGNVYVQQEAEDGDAITITGFDSQFTSNPYYIKNNSGHVNWWDIYKDSALTQPYTISDSPGIPSTIKGSMTGTGGGGGIIGGQTKLTYGLEALDTNPAFTNRYQGNVLSTTMISQKAMPDWGITNGQTLNATLDSVTENWTIDNSSQQTITISSASSPDLPAGADYDVAPGAIQPLKFPGEDADEPSSYWSPMFWSDKDTYGDVGPFDMQVTSVSSGNMKATSPGEITYRDGSGTYSGVAPAIVYGLVFAENGEWDNTIMTGAISVTPNSTASAGEYNLITFPSPIADDQRYGHLTNNSNSTVWANNKTEYANLPDTSDDIWNMDLNSGDDWWDYSGTDVFVRQHSGNDYSIHPVPYGTPGGPYSTYAWRYDSSIPGSGYHYAKPINKVKDASTNSGYPTSAILTGSTLAWDLHSVDWDDGKEISLYFVTGITTVAGGPGTVYVKNLVTSGHYEFYTDAGLTTPYTTSTFTTAFDLAGLDGVSTSGVAFNSWEDPAAGLKWVPYTTNQALISGTRKTVQTTGGSGGTSGFNDGLYAKTWSLTPGTFTTPNKKYNSNPYVMPTIIRGAVVQVNNLVLVDTTTGQISPASDEPYPYELDTVDIILPGNIPYSYQNVSNVKTYAAEIDDTKYWEPGATSATTLASTGETSAQITIAVDGSGYLQSATLVEETDAEGRYANGNDILIPLINLPDTYVPPTPTPAELEDVWDTDDEWADYGYAGGLKKWPRHVSPMSAEIVYNSPTIVNKSQGGVKYTRSSGHTNWRLDVTYPPMSAEDFQIFAAIAQAGQGQAMPFLFELVNKDSTPILWKDFYDYVNTTVNPLLKNAITPGDTTMLVEGFSSNEADAFVQGEVFIDGENENGNLHTSLSGTDSNIFGEAKIRTTWPFRTAVVAGNKVYKNPHHAVVTLASDDFEYQVDVNNYYYVSVSFDLDSWK